MNTLLNMDKLFVRSSRVCFILLLLVMQSESSAKYVEDGSLPEFTSQIVNISVAIGRDAIFTCNVKNLGQFRVGWVKSDSKAIQAIHDHVITHNPRVGVSGDLQTTFNLHIAAVQEEDRGQYMCQINTDPMTYQTATLDVMVPPDIVKSTRDQQLTQGASAKLECLADGYPTPKISWKREDDKRIKVWDPKLGHKKLRRYEGTTLTIPNVSPEDMGAYLCIATNDIPPARSKRVYLYVSFPPRVRAKEQLVRAGYHKNLLLKCDIRGYPQPMVIWNSTNGLLMSRNEGSQLHEDNFKVTEKILSPSDVTTTLLLRDVTDKEMGKYVCVAENSLGLAETIIRVYMAKTPAPPVRLLPTQPAHLAKPEEQEDDDDDERRTSLTPTPVAGGDNSDHFLRHDLSQRDFFKLSPNQQYELVEDYPDGDYYANGSWKKKRTKNNRRISTATTTTMTTASLNGAGSHCLRRVALTCCSLITLALNCLNIG